MRRLRWWIIALAVMQTCRLGAAAGQPVELVPASVLAWDASYRQVRLETPAPEVWFEFWLTNVCATNVLILGVETSCGCAVAQLPSLPWVVAPGESGPIRVNLDLRGRNSPVIKGLEIRTSAGLKALVVRADWPATNAPGATAATLSDRLCDLEAARRDRQALFRGHCAECHARPGDGKTGRELYAAVCAICHEAAARSPLVPDLKTRPTPATRAAWTRLLNQGLEGTLMPAFARRAGGPLTEAQIQSLVAYFLRERPFDTPTRAPVPAAPPRHPGAKPTPMSTQR